MKSDIFVIKLNPWSLVLQNPKFNILQYVHGWHANWKLIFFRTTIESYYFFIILLGWEKAGISNFAPLAGSPYWMKWIFALLTYTFSVLANCHYNSLIWGVAIDDDYIYIGCVLSNAMHFSLTLESSESLIYLPLYSRCLIYSKLNHHFSRAKIDKILTLENQQYKGRFTL